MAHSHHGKDGRFRDSTGLISFEYDRNDSRHIQQELDHSQLGHEEQYGNCWICHDYTPPRFKTQREVDADTDQDSHPSFKHQPRYPVLLREDVAAGMDPLSTQRFWPPSTDPDTRANSAGSRLSCGCSPTHRYSRSHKLEETGGETWSRIFGASSSE